MWSRSSWSDGLGETTGKTTDGKRIGNSLHCMWIYLQEFGFQTNTYKKQYPTRLTHVKSKKLQFTTGNISCLSDGCRLFHRSYTHCRTVLSASNGVWDRAVPHFRWHDSGPDPSPGVELPWIKWSETMISISKARVYETYISFWTKNLLRCCRKTNGEICTPKLFHRVKTHPKVSLNASPARQE